MVWSLYFLTAVERGCLNNLIPGNQKHLSLQDHLYIEKELSAGSSFKDIARFLCKDPSTISKEVKKHRFSDWYHKDSFFNAHNFCIHRYHCRKTNVRGKIILCGIKCTSCPAHNKTCRDFVQERCNRLGKAPYVCNGCDKSLHKCSISHKYLYDARFAHRKYRETLSTSRSGINMTKSKLAKKTNWYPLWSIRDSLLIRLLRTTRSWICLSVLSTPISKRGSLRQGTSLWNARRSSGLVKCRKNSDHRPWSVLRPHDVV